MSNETQCGNSMLVNAKESKIIDRFRSKKERLELQLEEINIGISLLEKNPEIEMLLTSIQRVGIY